MTDKKYLYLFPILFVLVWSTGWIVAKFATFYGEPLSFLSLRYAFAGGLLTLYCFFVRAKWPDLTGAKHALISGILLHAIYLGGVWWVIKQDMPASFSGMLAALQPLMTALLARLLIDERLRRIQKLGLLIGLGGLSMALAPKIAADLNQTGGLDINWPLLITINVVAMLSAALGTLYQKKHLQEGDLRTITVLQYAAALAVTLPFAFFLEEMKFVWSVGMWLTLLWSVFGLSFGAIGLFLLLIRAGEVSRAASLIYLIPPVIAVQTYFYFGEKLGLIEILGMLITVFGVYLVSRPVKT